MDAAKNTSNNRASARALLMQVEKSRRTPEGRDLYWNAKRWEKYLELLLLREFESDQQFAASLETVQLGSEAEIMLEERIDQTLQDDIDWYEQRLKDMKALLSQWATYDVETTYFQELRYHTYLIERQLNARKVRRLQFEIETLERRRRSNEGLPPGLWARYMHDLSQLFKAQEQLYLEAEDPTQPDLIQARLEWLYSIRAIQQETYKLIGKRRSFDRTGYLADQELLNQAIKLYEPPSLWEGLNIGKFLRIILAGVLIVIVLTVAIQPRKTEGLKGEAESPSTTQDLPRIGGEISVIVPSTDIELNQQGIDAMARNNYELAERYFQAAINGGTDFHEPYNNLAFCLYERGEIDEAIELWRTAIKLNSERPDAYAGLGMALHQKGHLNDGWMMYQQAINIDARYLNADWLRRERLWSERAITDSTPLRMIDNQ